MHFIWFLCLFVLIWLRVQVVIHKILILSFWQHLWCETFIAVVFLHCTHRVHLSISAAYAVMSFPWIFC